MTRRRYSIPGCDHCPEQRPAACYGSYEGDPAAYACDECCGHGCEDGHCDPVHPTLVVDFMRDVDDFHEKFGLQYRGDPRVLDVPMAELRRRRLKEEVVEYSDASRRAQSSLVFATIEDRDQEIATELEHMMDALVDEIYIVAGTALLHGFSTDRFYEAWRRVHEANMAKQRAQSPDESKHGSTYDIIKPPGWTPPSHADLVADHIHRRREP